MSFQIAMDGPAGAGKSTIAKQVAKELGFVYVDTGAMYRALGLLCVNNKIDLMDETAVTNACDKADVTIKYVDGVQTVLLNGENVNGLIRTSQVSEAASVVSTYKYVRKKLVLLQQALAQKENVVMDGRDIASVVLPNAQVKIYLDASVSERAKRRYLEQKEKGLEVDLLKIEKEIEERDYRDMHRSESPLVRVEEAVYIDSSDMTIDEVSRKVIDITKGAMENGEC